MSGENTLYDITNHPGTGAFSAITGRDPEFYTISNNFPVSVPTPGFYGFQLDSRPDPATLELYFVDSAALDSDAVGIEIITSGTPNATQALLYEELGWLQFASANDGRGVAALYDAYGANYNLANVTRIIDQELPDALTTAGAITDANFNNKTAQDPVAADILIGENASSGIINFTVQDFLDLIAAKHSNFLHVHTNNGYGSTNNKIPRFSTVVTNTGSGFTYADSVADGASITINKDGVAMMSFVFITATGVYCIAGISKNSNQLTTAIYSITAAHRIAEAAALDDVASGSAGSEVMVTVPVRVSAGDVLRPHTDGATARAGQEVRSLMIFSLIED